MSFIKADKISYSYPVLDDTDDFDTKKKKGEDVKEQTEVKPQQKHRGENALKEVSLEVHQGQFLCILGRNGSGKSTFAKHLNALLLPSEGTLWVDGIDTQAEDQIWTIRKTVGMVFQNPDNQIIGSVVDEDVAFGLENLGVPSEEIQKEVASALDGVGMSEFAKYSPNKLSGGQKQRVAVAGVLAMRPKCIVLDESTAMLDPRGRKEVMETVKKLNKEMGITIISITHFMEEALDADYIYVMHKGEVALQGTPKEIFSHGTELYTLGLWFPQIYHLAYILREKGMDLPNDIIYADELKAALEQKKK